MKVGDVVISVCGHDIGQWYIVACVSKNFAYVIDGKNKSIQKPKKKKFKHLAKTSFFADAVAQKLELKQYIQNAEVRKTLKFFKNDF